jgi:holo-[acyl-carrier protein] synthase
MIHGIGTDIVEIRRVQDSIVRYGERFLARIFTDAERSYCHAKAEPARYASYAARFAAKEAFSKALGTGIGEHAAWTDVEIFVDDVGKPHLRLHGAVGARLQEQYLHLTLAHAHDYATAMVVIESTP